MAIKTKFIEVVFFSLSISQAYADESLLGLGSDAFLSQDNEIAVVVSDDVDGGCMPRPNSVKTSAEAALIRNGFEITESTPFTTDFNISTIGYASNGGCIVAYRIVAVRMTVVRIPLAAEKYTFVEHSDQIAFGLLSGDRSSMQQRIQDAAIEAADKYLLITTTAKKRMRNDYPELSKEIKKAQTGF